MQRHDRITIACAASLALLCSLAGAGTPPVPPRPDAVTHAVTLDGPWRGWIGIRIEWRLAPPLERLVAAVFGTPEGSTR